MTQFYKPDLGIDFNNPFARDAENKLVRRSYWLDMSDHSIILAMTSGVGANIENSEKRAHLMDINRASLIEKICIQEILPPED
jgi:hypothetical protein|tara:strand:- start:29 stop:277 length:249 start_codon:yes stop_codon:yes gene_type:complete